MTLHLNELNNNEFDTFIDRVESFIKSNHFGGNLYTSNKSTLKYLLSDTITLALKQKPSALTKEIPLTADDVIDQIDVHCQRVIHDQRYLAYIELDSLQIKADAKALVARNEFSVSRGCAIAILGVLVDCIGMCLAPLGISATEARVIANNAIEEAGAEVINGFQAAVEAIANAKGVVNTSIAIASLFMQFIRAIGLKGFLASIKHSLPWYRWLIIGAIAAAQITVWVATDGLGLAAEIALETLAIATTVEDAIEAGDKCSAG